MSKKVKDLEKKERESCCRAVLETETDDEAVITAVDRFVFLSEQISDLSDELSTIRAMLLFRLQRDYPPFSSAKIIAGGNRLTVSVSRRYRIPDSSVSRIKEVLGGFYRNFITESIVRKISGKDVFLKMLSDRGLLGLLDFDLVEVVRASRLKKGNHHGTVETDSDQI